MPDESFTTQQYRLRAGGPMPIKGVSNFVLHTFMGEESDITVILCTQSLPKSSEFRGQGGDLVSANFSRVLSTEGTIFSGQKVGAPKYVEERD